MFNRNKFMLPAKVLAFACLIANPTEMVEANVAANAIPESNLKRYLQEIIPSSENLESSFDIDSSFLNEVEPEIEEEEVGTLSNE